MSCPDKLKAEIGRFKKVMLAFSGGVDSTLLLRVAVDVLGVENVIAVTGLSETFTQAELDTASSITKSLSVCHLTFKTEEMQNPEFRKNGPLRCYHCKKEFFVELEKIAAENGADAVLDGSNSDDLNDYRPGRKAAAESGVISPFIICGISKEEIRALAKEYDIPVWNKPANPCLASRVPYGEEITQEKIDKIFKGETFLREHGFRNLRVRIHGESLAKIEAEPADIVKLFCEPLKTELTKAFKSFGFTWISVDIEGYRTGSMNETLSTEEKSLK